MKRCKNVSCIHRELYRTVLKSLDFFVLWNQEKVPRLFVEKLNEINQKLCTNISLSNEHILFTPSKSVYSSQNSCESKDRTVESAQVQEDSCIRENSYLMGSEKFCSSDSETTNPKNLKECKSKSQETSNIKKCPKSKVKNVKNLSETKLNEQNCDKSTENLNNTQYDFLENNISNDRLMNKTTNTCEKNLFSDQNSVGAHELESNSKTPKNGVENKSGADNSLSSKQFSKKRFVRPFSLADTVANLRNEIEKQIITVKSPASKDNSLVTEENEKIDATDDCFQSEVRSDKKRKRKRRRSRVQKDKKSKIEQPFPATKQFSCTNNTYTSFLKKQSSHIRFTSNSEEEEEDVNNESIDKNEIDEDYKCKEIIESEKMEHDKINAENLFAMISKKKEVLLLQDTNNYNKNGDMAMTCDTLENNNISDNDKSETLYQNSVVLYNGSTSPKTRPSDIKSFDDTFTSLKNRFSYPEIFERFY